MATSARSVRERIRHELTREILEAARAQVGREGAAALSVRGVARELQMAPSAIYRYFPGRDALLTALIVDAFESLAGSAEAAGAPPGGGALEGDRWLAVTSAIRAWALAHPHEWALVFGSPVPGYRAPATTIAPYARIVRALAQPVLDAHAAGRLGPPSPPATSPAALTRALAAGLAPVQADLLPRVALATVARTVQAWAEIVGLISLELFGHWANAVLDPDAVFQDAMRTLAVGLGLSLQTAAKRRSRARTLAT